MRIPAMAWIAAATLVLGRQSQADPLLEITLPGLQTTAPVLHTKLNHYLSPTEFPAVGSEERYWACLVSLDPINRKGVLRHEGRDRMIEFTLLPYASLYYRGAPAALGDFPEGTMVEAWGYGDTTTQTLKHILRLSDDFSVKSFANQAYRIDAIDLGQRTFSATIVSAPRTSSAAYEVSTQTTSPPTSGAAETKVQFQFNDQTRWYRGKCVSEPAKLAIGQTIKVNFIRKFNNDSPVITRCKEVWLDMESQDLATALQYKSFVSYARDRGFPLRIDTVEDKTRVLTATLLETGLPSVHTEWKIGPGHDLSPAAASLRMWEPAGGQGGPDRIGGVTITAIEEMPVGYGCGGAKITLTVPYLIEGFRPGCILKLYANGMHCPCLPIEERLPKEFDPFQR